MALETEMATYHRELPGLLDLANKFVLIHGDSVASTWESFEDAVQEGYRIFGLQPFLVKQIQAEEYVHSFTRDIRPLCQS